MPYYLTKVTNHLKNIDKVSRPTFMIEQLSGFVLDKHPLHIAEWLQSISLSMDNPKKIIHLILFQPSKKDEISASDASFILHLCPHEAVTAFIKKLSNCTNWVEKHDAWLETLEDEEEGEEEGEEKEEEQEQNDHIQECSERLRDYLDREDFENLLEHSGLDDTNKVTELFEDLQTMFTEVLHLYWRDIINVLTHINYGDMSPECLELLKNQTGSPDNILLGDFNLIDLTIDDDSNDDDEYDSMPELVESEEDIIYERVDLPWWSQPSTIIRV